MSIYRETLIAVLILASVGSSLAWTNAVAQATALEEVVVTARKKVESLQETPISISVFTAQQIENQGIQTIDDIALRTPGFSFHASNGRQDFFRPVIRGQSNILGDANASFFIDGVFVNGAVSTLMMNQVERVEVLKGPQSALFGRATFAGAINYVTKRPGDEFAGKLSLTAAQDGDYRGSVNISGPIIDEKLSFYLGVGADTFDGQYRALQTDGSTIPLGGTQTTGVEGGLFLTPTENLDIRFRISYSESDDGQVAEGLQRETANNFSLFDPLTNPYTPEYYKGTLKAKTDFSAFSNNCLEIDQMSKAAGDRTTCGMNTDTLRLHLVGDWDIHGWTLSQSAAYNEFNSTVTTDGDYSEVFGLFGYIQLQHGSKLKDHAFETRLTSPQESRIRGAVGYYYYHKDEDDPQFRAFTSFGVVITAPRDIEDTTNNAFFGSIEMDVTESVTASLEGRYAKDERVLNEGRPTMIAKGTPEEFGAIAGGSFYSFTPRMTLRWDVTDKANLYTYVAKGNKPGGFNSAFYKTTTTADGFQKAIEEGQLKYGEETAWTYEVGAKTMWLDNRLMVNVAAYYIDWTEQQLVTNTTVLQTSGLAYPDTVIVNAGKTEIKGVELEAVWQATDKLTISGTLSYTDPTLKKFADIEQAILFDFEDGTINYSPTMTAEERNAFVEREGSVAGNHLPQTSEWQYSLSTVWQDHLGSTDWDWVARADYQFESSRYSQIHNLIETGDTKNLNMRLGVLKDGLTITGWVTNATNDKSSSFISRIRDYSSPTRNLKGDYLRGFQYGVPRERQFGVTVTKHF